MPSTNIRMTEPSPEVLLRDITAKLSINNGNDEKLCKSTPMNIKSDVKNVGTNFCPYGSAAQTIASIFTPKLSTMSSVEAIQRCHELELELKSEKKTVEKLRAQLAHSEKMLSQLRSVHSKCPMITKFEDLPEELIIHIFSYLPTDTLIYEISKVCRQWKRLSEDVDLWSKVCIDSDFPRLIRTLHHAPCLRSAVVPSEYLTVHDDDEDEYLQVLTRTRCRLRSLTLPDFQPIMLRMVRNQMGHLRVLHINSWWDNMRFAHRGEVWAVLALLDLQSLTLHEFDGGNSYFHSAFRPAPGQFASLRHLDLYCKVVPGGLLPAIIRACSKTLETVSLPPKSKGEVVELLAECPLLREANVPFVGEVCALKANESLDFVELNSEWLATAKVKSMIPEVVRFLRMPTNVSRLRTLFFQGMPVNCKELLQAVCKVKSLRYIRIHNLGEPETTCMVPQMLRDLPNLERFTIAALPEPGVIDAIGPDACPRLRELTFIGMCHDDLHGCRVPALLRLLRHRPGLHVFLDLGLGVKGHLESLYPDCLRYHRLVCADESLWHRFFPVMTAHPTDTCSWCRFRVEDYATCVNLAAKLVKVDATEDMDMEDEVAAVI